MKRFADDRGAAALFIAAGMVLFLGMAAMAIDLGLAFNERRSDQSSVDSGVMAGALSAIAGGQAVRDDALDYVRTNLPTTYTNAEWQALWEGCVDPAAVRNEGGAFNFVALPVPAGWTAVDPANWCLSFESARGLFRVRVPDQIVDTSFGRVLGRTEFVTTAAAVGRINFAGAGGILPFGLPSGAAGHVCLSSSPSGYAFDPCTGAASGNFGTLKGRKFGNPEIPTMENCNASPLNTVLAQNIAHGYDHIVVPDADGLVSTEVRDVCHNPLVDTLNTDTGFPSGTEEGLVGPVSGGYPGRLTQSPTTIQIDQRPVDNRPLWAYLNNTADYGGLSLPTSDDAPWQCAPSTFTSAFSGGSYDWNTSLPGDEPNDSWHHMDNCINAYTAGSYTGVMFRPDIIDNVARFAYIPEFWESTLGTGNSWLHIRRFRAVYLQTTLWKKGNDFILHSPGENLANPNMECFYLNTPMYVPCPPGTDFRMRQLTAVIIPDAALPVELRGELTTPGNTVNPFSIELVK